MSRESRPVGGVKGHNMKRNYLTGKLRPVAGELHIGADILSSINPVRNSSGALNPAGIILKSNPAVGGTAEQRGIISNGVKENHGKDCSFTKYKWAS